MQWPGKDTSNIMKVIKIILYQIPHGADLTPTPTQSEAQRMWTNVLNTC